MTAVSRRDFLKTAGTVGIGAAAGLSFPAVLRAQGGGSVKVGVLHSLSGTMAISEVSLRDVVMMAVEEVNAKGGVMGKKIEPVIDRVFPFAEARAAYEHLASGRHFGKVVIRVD